MTLYELVERERRHVRGREVIAGALLVGGAAALIISLGAGVGMIISGTVAHLKPGRWF